MSPGLIVWRWKPTQQWRVWRWACCPRSRPPPPPPPPWQAPSPPCWWWSQTGQWWWWLKSLKSPHISDGGVERIDFLQLWVWVVKMKNHRLFVVFMIGDNCFEDDNKGDGCGGLVLRCFPFTFSPRLRPCSSFSPLLPSPPHPPPHPPRQPQQLVLEYLLAIPRMAPEHVFICSGQYTAVSTLSIGSVVQYLMQCRDNWRNF